MMGNLEKGAGFYETRLEVLNSTLEALAELLAYIVYLYFNV